MVYKDSHNNHFYSCKENSELKYYINAARANHVAHGSIIIFVTMYSLTRL